MFDTRRLLLLALLTSPLDLFAGSIDVGSFVKPTGSAPVSQTISHNLGETPKCILFWTVTRDTEGPGTNGYISYGITDGTTEYSFSSASQHNVDTTNASTRAAEKAVTVIEWGQNLLAEADLTAWDSDDFTLNWTTNGFAFATRIHFVAIGGTDISAKVISWDSATSTGDLSITGVGFEPDVVLHMWSPSVSTIPSSVATADLGFGAMDASGDEWAFSLFCDDNLGTANTTHAQAIDACLIDSNFTTVLREAAFVSMDTDGFTINYSTAGIAARKVASLCISGVNAKAGSFSKTTSSAPVSQSITGTLFEPELLILGSWGEPSNGIGDDGLMCFAATDGTTEGASAFIDEDGTGFSDVERVDKTTKVFILPDDQSNLAIEAEADFTSFDSDGFTLNWTTNDAEATQICYLALVPFAAVGVRLSKLEATALSSGTEVLWRTEREIDNVGFHVYRQRGSGARTRVTRSLISGSASLATLGTALTSAQRYAWPDPAGQCGDLYWVEDYDLNGRTQLHGPVAAQLSPAPQRLICSPSSAASTSAASVTGASTPPAPRFADATSPIDATVAARIAASPALWVEVDSEGWTRVTHEDWVAAGLSATVPASLLQLYYRGVEYAIDVEGGADGTFDPGDAVTFYGLGVDTPDTSAAVYALTIGETPGKRISQSSATSTAPPQSSLPHTVLDAEETQYVAALRNGTADNFFGDLLTGSPMTCYISLPCYDISSAMPVSLEVSLQGLGGAAHNVTISVNGATVGAATFTATDHVTTEFTLSPILGGSILELTFATSGGADFVFLDSIAVTYPRDLVVGNDFFRGTAPGSSTLQLSEVTPGTRVFDVTDPSNVVELIGTSTPIAGGLALTVPLPGGVERTWAAVPPNTYSRPTHLRPNQPSKWRAQKIEVDFVVVAPQAWLEALRPLAQRRRKEGLSTLLVAVEDLYDEWNGGAKGTEPIAQFLRDAKALPTYLLLVGDTTYDPRQRLPGTRPSVLPTRLIDSARLETASDQWFGDLDQDGVSEIAVGRIPAQTVAEVERYVEKVLAYAEASTAVATSNQALIVTDDDDGFPFGAAGSLAQGLLSPSMSVTLVDRNVTPVAMARDQIANALTDGAAIAAYFGHGGTGGWGAEDLLTTAQVQSIRNTAQSPIVISASCLNGFFHHRLSETIGEAWVLGSAGAIAVWGSTSLSNPYPQRALSLAILGHLMGGGRVRLGDAFLAAQGAADPGTVRITVLLGDPTVSFSP